MIFNDRVGEDFFGSIIMQKRIMLVLKKCFEKQLIMPLFDKNRSLLDNASDVVEKHKKLIMFAMVLRWMTKNKRIVLLILLIIFLLIDSLICAL